MASPRPLGIDLGTTYSAMATIDSGGRSVMIPNSDGQILTPSIVFFDAKKFVVGHLAKQMALTHVGDTAVCVKRDMGKKHYSQPIRGTKIPPEVIQSCILKRLKDDVTAIHNQELAVVITVPAYFDDPRRRATAHAGEMAGLNVLDIVNEPTAAALAYGEQLGYLDLKTSQTKEPLKILVYDLGGGTFDATLLDMRPGTIKTLATDGDVRLGGRDWDEALTNFAADQFTAVHGQDPRKDPQSLTNLLLMAEQVKQSLTSHPSAIFEISFAGKQLPIPITRQLFEELTEVLLERTAYTTKELLRVANLEWKQLDRIILVGGSTRMPMVTRMLHELSGKLPERGVHPDEAVARGAAIYAKYLLSKRRKEPEERTFTVTNVNAHSLGLEGVDQRTQRRENSVLIPRNTSLPAKKVKRCVTNRENQQSIVVNVLEGESSDPVHCSLIGKATIRNLPEKLPQGWPVEVTYEYLENGRLAVRAQVPGTQKSIAIELQNTSGLDNEKVRRWKHVVTSDVGFDAFEEVLEEVVGEKKMLERSSEHASPGVANGTTSQRTLGANTPSQQPVAQAISAPSASAAKSSNPYSSPTAANNPLPQFQTFEVLRPRNNGWQRSAAIFAGFIVSAFLGLTIGYYIVANVSPRIGNFLNLPWPGLPEPRNTGK